MRLNQRHIAYGWRAALLAASLGAAVSPALAWNGAGHRLVAAVAWRQMDEGTRTTVGRILAAHPDQAAWLARNRQAEPAYAAFLEASTWADDIRRDARFHDDDDTATPAIAGFPDMARHRYWHYVDQPLFAAPVTRPGNGELDLRLARLGEMLAKAGKDESARAYALAWLIHLVGDAHQPLHTVSRYDGEGRGDDGGNALWVDSPFHPRRREMTLHAYWDDLPGPPWLRGSRLEAAADRLMPLGGQPGTPGSVRQWLTEGRKLSETVVYADLDGEVPTLDARYHERAQRTARECVALAGKRLALLLEELLRR